MAFYFLVKSPAYVRGTAQTVFRRREIVCKHLNERYKAGRNKDEEVLRAVTAELVKEGVEISEGHYRADKVLIRTAFMWLTGDEKEKKRIMGAYPPSVLMGVQCLMKDSIQTWEALMGLPTPPSPVATDTAPPTEVLKRVRLWESSAGVNVVDLLGHLIPELEKMLTEDQALKEENRRLMEEVGLLQSQRADDQRYIELAEGELTETQRKIDDLRQALRHAQATAHGATLEMIAEQHPEVPELTVIAQKLHQRDTRREIAEALNARLPGRFTWLSESGAITYQEPFRRELLKLAAEEQNQVIKQLERLATQGLEYPSLHTRKSVMRIPFSPPVCMVSRGADDLRFSWTKNGDLVIHWLFRKGDSRVRTSEQ